MTVVYVTTPINETHETWVRATYPGLVRTDGSLRALPVVEFVINPDLAVLVRAPGAIPPGTPLYIGRCPFPEEWAGPSAAWWVTASIGPLA